MIALPFVVVMHRTGDRVQAVWQGTRTRAALVWRLVVAVRAELLTAGAMLGGLALVALAFAFAFPRQARTIWCLAGAVACFGAAGLRLVGAVAWHGLYRLTRPTRG